jgi:hypothetical protein
VLQSESSQAAIATAKRLAQAITALFFIFAMIGILKHEMWRDEFQSWLIARDAHSFIQLYQNRAYTGHPMLWFVLVYVLTWFTSSPVAMQLLHVMLASASVYLFSRFAPFSTLEKVLFAFGYYSLYEYSIISRNYAQGWLLMSLFCVLYKRRRQNSLWLFVVLVLLANASAFGLALAVCLAGLLLIDFLVNGKKPEWADLSSRFFSLGSLFFLLGVAISIIQILPPKDSGAVQPHPSDLLDATRIKIVLSKIYDAYLLLPELQILPLWNSNGLIGINLAHINAYLFVSIILLFVASAILMRKPLALLLYWIGTIGLLCLMGLTNNLGPRHSGHLLLLFIATLWLANHFPARTFRNSSLSRFSGFGQRIQSSFLILILSVQAFVGANIYVVDLGMPFSASKEAARFIRDQKLSSLPVVGHHDWSAEGFAALLNKPIYYPERKEFGTFIIYDAKWNTDVNYDQLVQSIETVLGANNQQALLILNYQPSQVVDNQRVPVDRMMMSPTIELTLLKKFEQAMMFDEVYYIYLAERVRA